MKIEIWTDGSSRGNPGPGGWSAIIMTGEEVIELGGREDLTTNNRMELLAAIKGLQEVESPKVHKVESDTNLLHTTHYTLHTVEVLTDSQYVKKGMTEWIDGWIKKGWKGSTKKPVLNQDLWEMLKKEEDRLKGEGVKVMWTYVQAHVGITMNERADTIATMCADDANDLQLYRGGKKDYII